MNHAQQIIVRRSFNRIGAEVQFSDRDRFVWPVRNTYELDVQQVGRKERFLLRSAPDIDFAVLDVQPKDRHLLLMVKLPNDSGVPNAKFLRGHDERHFFTAAIPEGISASRVLEAKQALKPRELIQVETELGIKQGQRHARRRKLRDGSVIYRQGEFMFLPRPNFQPHNLLCVHYDEILSRRENGRRTGKPHIAKEAYRTDGELVYVSRMHPQGLNYEEYRALLLSDRTASRMFWETRQRARSFMCVARSATGITPPSTWAVSGTGFTSIRSISHALAGTWPSLTDFE